MITKTLKIEEIKPNPRNPKNHRVEKNTIKIIEIISMNIIGKEKKKIQSLELTAMCLV